MSDELKPCPFCGNEPTLREYEGGWVIECEHHGWNENGEARGNEAIAGDVDLCSWSNTEPAKTALINAWNARAERTCRIEWRGQVFEMESSIDCDGEYYCTACGDALPKWADVAWDDYQAAHFDGEPPFRHCPNCGGHVKVVKE